MVKSVPCGEWRERSGLPKRTSYQRKFHLQDDLVSGLIDRWRQVIPGLGMVALFGVVTIAFFWRVLFTPGVYFPPGGDFATKDFPQNVFAANSLQRGEIPLWNAYAMTGYPFAADPNVGLFYPLKLLLMLVIPGFTYREMQVLLIFHYFLSGVFAYALGRHLGMSKSGAFAAGLAFMLSGFMTAQLEHPNIVMTVTWFPLIFLFFRRAILVGHPTDAVASGVLLAISLLGGQQQFSILTFGWLLLWLVGYWASVTRGTFWRDLRAALLVVAIAFFAAAIQILPSLELISLSLRGELDAADAAAMNLPPIGWITLILPHFFGPNGWQAQSLWSGYGNWNEAYGYVGVVTLCLAGLSIMMLRRAAPGKPRYETWFLTRMALLALLMAAGNVTPLFGWAYTAIPVLRFLRVPARFIFWFDASLALLAGFGLDFFVRPTADKRGFRGIAIASAVLLSGAGAVLLIAVSTYGATARDVGVLLLLLGAFCVAFVLRGYVRGSRTTLAAVVIALVAVDLFGAHSTYNLTTHDPLTNFRFPQGLDPQRVGNTYRIDATPDALSAWEPLAGLIYSVPTASGLPWNPFTLSSFDDYWEETSRERATYDFLAVKYLVAPRGTALSEKWTLQPGGDPHLQVFENRQAIPRASVVYQSVIEPDREKVLTLLHSDVYDPRTTVLLESGAPTSQPAAESTVRIVSTTNNSIVLEATTPQPGYLVSSDAYYPGWRVWVDDHENQVLRANYAFRAVQLEAGHHTVRFEFDPLSWRIGLGISAITWGALGLALVVQAVTCLRRR